MTKWLFGAMLAVLVTAAPAHAAMNCGAVLDELAKAISGHVTMSPEHRAAMLRQTVSGYDSCMAGDAKSTERVRDMIMAQIRENLGGR